LNFLHISFLLFTELVSNLLGGCLAVAGTLVDGHGTVKFTGMAESVKRDEWNERDETRLPQRSAKDKTDAAGPVSVLLPAQEF
jgi:hypothetical protein